ncbi:MAG: FHA domain-containing protein [Turicibacter sp.]|nr:FHA domain-containing protein [Turicibacter sp.]
MYDIEKHMETDVKMGKTFVTLKIKTNIDLAAYRTITHTKPHFIVPFSGSEVNGEYLLSFDITADDFISLQDFREEMSPQNFVAFMKNVTDAAIQCTNYLANFLNLLITEEFAFVNPQTFDVRFIYAPLAQPIFSENEMNRAIYSLMRRFASDSDNPSWDSVRSRLWKVDENTSIYKANEIYTALKKELTLPKKTQPQPRHPKGVIVEPPSLTPPPNPFAPINPNPPIAEPQEQKRGFFDGMFGKPKPPPLTPPQPIPTGLTKKEQKKLEKEAAKQAKLQAKLDKKNKKAGIEPPLSGGMFSGGGGLAPAPTPQPPNPHISNFGNAGNIGNIAHIQDDSTLPLGDDDSTLPLGEESPCLYLLNNGQPTEKITISQTPFILGRQRGTVHYCFNETERHIGKEHATITCPNGQYSITDLSSRNGTYVNNIKIPANTPTALNPQDIIKLGKSELRFDYD